MTPRPEPTGEAPVADRRLTRRSALTVLGVAGAGVVAAGCGSGSSPSAATSTTGAAVATTGSGVPTTGTAGTAATTATSAATTPIACVLTPEVTQGPYYLDLKKVRSDITEGRPGRALELTIVVLDAAGCTPIDDASVDIWHCDANGVYSGFAAAGGVPGGSGGPGGAPPPGAPTGTQPGRPGRPPGSAVPGGPGRPGGPGAPSSGGETGDASANTTDDLIFLRGTQVSDGDGKVTFKTIYPGWYQGRAVHIHMKVHVGGKDVHTGQFFFDDATSDEVFAEAPYNLKGKADMRNADDSIYRGAGSATAVLALTPQGDGFSSTIAVGVKTS